VLRLVLRYAVTEGSMAWVYDHRIDRDRPIVDQPV
jgi:hypothetical protein